MKCDGCRRSWRKVRAGPMLHDEVWHRLAAEHETLCFGCILDRATKRKVDLSIISLLPCAFNLFHWPHSYFNLFQSTARQPLGPTVLNQWRTEAWNGRIWPEIPSRLWAEL